MPQFTLRIDLGHILTILVMVASVAMAAGEINAFKDRQTEIVDSVRELGRHVEHLDDRLTSVQLKQTNIVDRVSHLEDQLEEHMGVKNPIEHIK